MTSRFSETVGFVGLSDIFRRLVSDPLVAWADAVKNLDLPEAYRIRFGV